LPFSIVCPTLPRCCSRLGAPTGPNCWDGELYRKPNFNELNRKRSQEGDDAPSHMILARRMLKMNPPRVYVLSEGPPSASIMSSIFRAVGSVYTETGKRAAVCGMPVNIVNAATASAITLTWFYMPLILPALGLHCQI
jgi:hypothetical protein